MAVAISLPFGVFLREFLSLIFNALSNLRENFFPMDFPNVFDGSLLLRSLGRRFEYFFFSRCLVSETFGKPQVKGNNTKNPFSNHLLILLVNNFETDNIDWDRGNVATGR